MEETTTPTSLAHDCAATFKGRMTNGRPVNSEEVIALDTVTAIGADVRRILSESGVELARKPEHGLVFDMACAPLYFPAQRHDAAERLVAEYVTGSAMECPASVGIAEIAHVKNQLIGYGAALFATLNPIPVGARVRSFDFPDFPEGRSLSGPRACYVEGVVEDIGPPPHAWNPCERYHIRVQRTVRRGQESESLVGDLVFPPVNGAETFPLGRVTDGVVRID